MKDDISTPTAEGESPNEFVRDTSSTSDRSRAEAAIEDLRQAGGVFVNAVRATRILLAVAMREGDHLRIDGPVIWLKSRAAESVSLAVHELATNAVKYGAIACDGQIRVLWNFKRSRGGHNLHFEWLESGLDTKPRVQHEGFGHEMLLRSLPYDLGAETNIEFTTDGMRFTMKLPMAPNTLAVASK